ncbi:MAG: bifunctional acetate--CoA ligase family protein/GNAT family N-acetyltransferase [Chloroflexi bacterium]|nr:bifunctional acetate--CoA ligase family protein/GNAT family N-acetyltransferase [Chloroflexota bacterium]
MSRPSAPGTEAAHDLLHTRQPSLDVFFRPQRIAVVGATETPGSVGRTLMQNLLANPFGGAVYPVNLRRPSVLGVAAYPTIAAVPHTPDLAIIVTPAPVVPAVIAECVTAGVKGAIVISAGFKEIGPAGAALEQQILAEARRGPMRVIGPNCLGVMSPLSGLNATFAGAMARPGSVGFISQSGALCTAILDWSLKELVGFSAFISIGSMLDVGWGDLIDYLGNDPRTTSIVIYMETIGDARAFMSAAREVALTKPIIVIKAGRSEAAARAAASHTGALAGSDAVLDAAFHRCGVLRVDRISDLFSMAEVLAKQPRPRGPRLSIVTNAGGPGVLATDSLIANGGRLADLSPDTRAALDAELPPHWSHGNPIDVLGDAGPERYARAVEIVAADTGSDGLLVVLTPQAMTDATATAEALRGHAHLADKPILASWMGGPDVAAGESILNRSGIPTFPYPDSAARAFSYMWRLSDDLRALYETPVLAAPIGGGEPAAVRAAALLERIRAAGRALLTEAESKELLAIYGIPTVPTHIAATVDAAVAHAEATGYPVVLKLNSETVTHKTDVGGVRLNLRDAAAVREAFATIEAGVTAAAGPGHFQGVTVQPMLRLSDSYELIVGSSVDPQFGPVLLFGAGGQLVEVMADRALALPPLTTTLARRLMEKTRIYRALQGTRGRPPGDLRLLERLLVRVSQLVGEQPWIAELDINPLLASHEHLVALDARVVLHPPSTDIATVPQPAIRPYPSRYVAHWTTRGGEPVTIRPIRPEDEPLMVRFHEMLSAESVYLRYFHMINLSQRTAHERLIRICFVDYDREMALVVEGNDIQGERAIFAAGRLSKRRLGNEAEFAMLVADAYQGQGIGTEMLRRLLAIARDEGLARVTADILPANTGMRQICEELGFHLVHNIGEGVVQAVYQIT